MLTASTLAEGPGDRYAGLKRWMQRCFALHFVPLVWLGDQLSAAGYTDYEWSLPGEWFGFTSARKQSNGGSR